MGTGAGEWTRRAGPRMPVGLRDLEQGCHRSLPCSVMCQVGQPLFLPGGCREDSANHSPGAARGGQNAGGPE